MMMSMNGRSNRYPFTASQWQELEHQALVYKYMITGMPIPPDLLFSIKTSYNSSISSKFLLHQPTQHFGWSSGFQIGYGKKIDPEPGRCRRTDGKKWRCSKEAYSDSKYCERHMHRGRNRSRKPVETNDTTTPKTIAPKTTHSSSSSSNFLYPHFSNPDSLGIALSSQENTTNSFFLDSNAYSTKDYRKSYGQEIDEHAFFTEASSNYGTTTKRNDCSWQLAPLPMGSPTSQMKSNSYFQNGKQPERQNYYYNSEMHIERDDNEPKKVMHHFLDEYVPKENKLSTQRTQLSISTPNSSVHDFFFTKKCKHLISNLQFTFYNHMHFTICFLFAEDDYVEEQSVLPVNMCMMMAKGLFFVVFT